MTSLCITGEGNNFEDAQADHDRRYIALMERCHQRSIKLNAGKLRFKLKEVKFMGTIIWDNGMKPDPDNGSGDNTDANTTEQASTPLFHWHG